MTDYGTVSHNALPPMGLTDDEFTEGEWACEAPGCGESFFAAVHDELTPEGGVHAAVYSADFGDVD